MAEAALWSSAWILAPAIYCHMAVMSETLLMRLAYPCCLYHSQLEFLDLVLYSRATPVLLASYFFVL